MARIVFVGNCQARAVRNAYENFVSPWTGDTATFVDAYEFAPARATEILHGADVVVGQVAEFRSNIDIDTVPASVRKLKIPVVSGGFLWPFGGQPHPRTISLPYMPLGPYSAEIGDSYLNRLINKGMDPEEAFERYLNLDIHKTVNLDRLLELNLEKQRNRDTLTDFRVGDIIEKYFRDERLFLTPYHPNLRVARYLIKETFRKLGVEQAAIDRMESCLTTPPFPRLENPIHPSVQRHFGLKYAGADQRYRYHSEGTFTFAEYVKRYLRFDWNQPLEEAFVLSREKKHEQAVVRFKHALELSPNSSDGYLGLSGVLDRLGRTAEAIAAARMAVELEPDNAPALRHLGILLGRSDQLGEAERLLRKAVSLLPGSGEYLVALSQVLRRQQRIEQAISLARQAVEMEPRNEGFRIHLSGLLEIADRLDEAEQMLRSMLDLRPDSVNCLGALGRFLLRQNRLEEALTVASRAEKIEPENAAITGLIGQLLGRAGKYAEAEMILRRAIARSPSTIGFYTDLSHVVERQDRRHEAIGILQDLISSGSNDPHIHARLGHLLQQGGDLTAAEREFRTAAEAEPGIPGFRVSLADTLNLRGKREEAVGILREIIARGTNEAHVYGRLGHLLWQSQDLRGAERQFRIAITMAADSTSFRASLAEVLTHLGRQEQAAAVSTNAQAG